MQEISFLVDLRIFSEGLLYSAAYVILDDAYVLLDEEGENLAKVTIVPKFDGAPELLKERFNEELLNYAVYSIITSKNKHIRHAFVQRALLTNGFEAKKQG